VRFPVSDRLVTAAEADPQRLFAVSRDGQRVAFIAERDGVPCLYLRELRTLQAIVIPGTENAMQPFFSPDGQRIGFFAGGKLKVVSLAGGAPEDRAQINWPRGGTWAPDDTIIFSPSDNSGLWQVPASGGAVRVLAQPDPAKGERSYRWPEVSPDGGAVFFTLATSDIQSFDNARLMVRSLRTGEQRELLRGGSAATCTMTGHLLFARAGALMAAPFDTVRLRVTGAEKPVLDGLVTYPISGAAQYAVAADGTLIYIAGKVVTSRATLAWVDPTGKTSSLPTEAAAYQAVSVSDDGRWAALEIDGANASIWALDLVRMSPPTRVSSEWSNNGPFWSPDGARVCFVSERGGVSRFYCQAPGGGSAPEPVTPHRSSRIGNGSWAPSGRLLIFGELNQASRWDLWTCAVGGEPVVKSFLQTSYNELNPRLSSDGRWVAYESDETGSPEVYVQPFPGPGRKERISADGGTQPLWARKGHELFYRHGDAIIGVTIKPSPIFSAGQPRVLFRRALRVAPLYPYDVAPDGRFLIIESLPPPVLGPLTTVLNWFEELKAKVAGK
jgi:serine/threonine-protein kinase